MDVFQSLVNKSSTHCFALEMNINLSKYEYRITFFLVTAIISFCNFLSTFFFFANQRIKLVEIRCQKMKLRPVI